YYWPISIFEVRTISLRDVFVAVTVAIAFVLFTLLLERVKYDIRLVCITGVLLIAGTTFIQGVEPGFYAPVAGYSQYDVYIPNALTGQEYFHDALTIDNAWDFFCRYNEIQPTLHNHAHTHPPGAVLTYYFLTKVFHDPGLIAVVIMLAAAVPTVLFFYLL